MKEKLHEKFLLYRLQTKKDPEAYGALYDVYVARIYRFIFFKVKTKEEAEDLTSEVFLKAWHYITEHAEVYNFSALLYRIARNLIIDHYRTEKKRADDVALLGDDELEDTGNRGVQQQIPMAEMNELAGEHMEIYLRKLKDDYREVITMRYIDELPMGDIATILDKSEVNVRVTLHRALKALRRLMEQKI